MAQKFSPEAFDEQLPEKRSSQQLLLLLLLLLILLFAYLYFFTGLIRPKAEAPAPQPAAPQMVKKPLPPRVAQNNVAQEEKAVAAKEAKAPVAPEAKAGAAGKAGKAPAPGEKPGAAAKGATAPAPPAGPQKTEAKGVPAKPAPAAPPAPAAKPAKNAVPPQQATAAKHPVPEHAAAEPKAAAKPGAREAKPVIEKKPAANAVAQEKGGAKAAANKAAGSKTEKEAVARKGTAAKGVAAAEAGEKTAKEHKGAAAAGRFALELENDLAESEMAPVMSKLKRAGISRVVKNKTQKGEQVHRLFLADFGNHDEAQEELERLRLAAPGAFMLRENGRYAVYAGSYLREGKAAVEQDRLYEKGVKLLLKSATAPVSVVKLRAGSFPDQASAARIAERLKKEGVAAKVVKLGK